MSLKPLRLKKGEDKRLREGHVWVYSNEIDSKKTPLKNFTPGEEVIIQSYNEHSLGIAYINPHSLIAARLFSQDSKERLNADFIASKLNQALYLREKLFSQPYYRLVFAESDDLPGLIIDRYGEHIVVQCNTYGMETRNSEIVTAIQKILPSSKSILWRNDSSIRTQEGLTQFVSPGFGQPPEHTIIEENDVSYYVPLWKGQKTGWFFDHRLNRSRLKDYVIDGQILDVFSYLGGWGILAARYGAKQVHCIDSSAFACEWIYKNAALNQIQNKVNVICEEAVPTLQRLNKDKKKFDVIILDPPAFIKKRKDIKEGILAYQRINTLALRLLNPNGILISSSCSMQLSYEQFVEVLHNASLQAHCHVHILERGHQGPDHPIHFSIPETDYLKAVIMRRLS